MQPAQGSLNGSTSMKSSRDVALQCGPMWLANAKNTGSDVGQGSCGNANGIGGPVMVYLSKVTDASTADVSELFFKIFESVWECNSSGMRNADDFWG
ncbi:hypothetical protein S40288_10561 [Stachybotrys chartarum IBT 40288]|nr:hypothetical protein S40288_10561 [Stachybotrys chartarum IBT 40288]